MSSRLIYLSLLINLLITGCAWEMIPSDSGEVVSELYQEASAAIIPGQTHKTTIENMLGAPFLSDDQLRFAVYRRKETDKVLLVANFIPIFPAGKSDFHGYFLVLYDENEVVEETGHFFISEPSKGQAQLREYGKKGEATIGGITFGAYWVNEGSFLPDFESQFYLFAPFPLAEQFSGAKQYPQHCTVYLTSYGEDLKSIYLDKLSTSERLQTPLNPRLIGLIHNGSDAFLQLDKTNVPDSHRESDKHYYFRLRVHPGMYVLTAAWRLDNSETSKEFSCSAGDTRVITISGIAKGQKKSFSWKGYRLDSFTRNIDISDQITGHLKEGDLLIYGESSRLDMYLWPQLLLHIE